MKDSHCPLRLTNLVHRGALWPLAPAAIAVGLASQLRQSLYDWGLIKAQRCAAPVISVGNVIAGGTGKTPVVAWLHQQLKTLGYQPAVIARGYGSGADGVNDEAQMLKAAVHCHPNRRLAAARAIAAGANCLIMDDGFQHRRLARDLDLICMDATRPWGWSHWRRGAFLPWGLLRESAPSLRRAHGIIATRCDQAPPPFLYHLRQLAHALGLPFWQSHHQAQCLRSVGSDDAHPLSTLTEGNWWLMSAIAQPQAFAHTARQLGAVICGHSLFPDHHRFLASDLMDIARQAARHHARILCTAKDAVKIAPLLEGLKASADSLPADAVQHHQRWHSLEIAIAFYDDDERHLNRWLQQQLASVSRDLHPERAIKPDRSSL